jgi:hypothetical protein
MQLIDIVKELTNLNEHDIEYVAMMLYDADKEQALRLMRDIGIMDMESRLTQRDGVAV